MRWCLGAGKGPLCIRIPLINSSAFPIGCTLAVMYNEQYLRYRMHHTKIRLFHFKVVGKSLGNKIWLFFLYVSQPSFWTWEIALKSYWSKNSLSIQSQYSMPANVLPSMHTNHRSSFPWGIGVARHVKNPICVIKPGFILQREMFCASPGHHNWNTDGMNENAHRQNYFQTILRKGWNHGAGDQNEERPNIILIPIQNSYSPA